MEVWAIFWTCVDLKNMILLTENDEVAEFQ